MDVVFLSGRLLFSLLFISSGFMAHLGEGGKQGREYARSLGAPSPDLLVPLSGIAIIAGGLMVALGLWADLGALFIKNVALLGAAIIVFWAYNQGQDLPASITDALFGRI